MDLKFLELVTDRVFAGIQNDRLGWHLDGRSNVSVLKDYDDVVPYLKYANSFIKGNKIEFILNTIKQEALSDEHLDIGSYLQNEGSYSSYIFTDMMGLYKEPWYPFKAKFRKNVIDFSQRKCSHLKRIQKLGLRATLPRFHLFAELNSRLPYILRELGENEMALDQDVKITKCLLQRANRRKANTIFKGLTNSLDFKVSLYGFDDTLEFCKLFGKQNYRHFYVYDTLADHLLASNLSDQSVQKYADYINHEQLDKDMVRNFKVIDDLTDWISFLFKLYYIGIMPAATKTEIRDLIATQKQRISDYLTCNYVKTKFVTLSLKLLIVEQGLAGDSIDFRLLEDR